LEPSEGRLSAAYREKDGCYGAIVSNRISGTVSVLVVGILAWSYLGLGKKEYPAVPECYSVVYQRGTSWFLFAPVPVPQDQIGPGPGCRYDVVLTPNSDLDALAHLSPTG
jgi:hypothetical protein